MNQNKQLAVELNKYAGDKVKQEKIMLGLIQEQTEQIRLQQKLARGLAPGLARAGVRGDLTMSGNSKNQASGFIPNYSSGVTPMERQKEQASAIKSGYAPGSVRKMSVSGMGDVVYNSNEKVKFFPGMEQPAIMPPRGSRAGGRYSSSFKSKHGFDPYGSKNNSYYNSGLVPNFAAQSLALANGGAINVSGGQVARLKAGNAINVNGTQYRPQDIDSAQMASLNAANVARKAEEAEKKEASAAMAAARNKELADYKRGGSLKSATQYGNTLFLPKANMHVQSRNGFTGDPKNPFGYHMIKAPLMGIGTKGKGGVLENTSYMKGAFNALSKMGVSHIAREMFFTNYDTKNYAKDAANKAYRLGRDNDVIGKEYERGLLKYTKEKGHPLQGYESTSNHNTARADLVKLGSIPIEAKSGYDNANLVGKSISLTSENHLENYLIRNGLMGGDDVEKITNSKNHHAATTGAKMSGSKNTQLQNLGPQARLNRLKFAKRRRLSEGLVPNFADSRNRAQKIRDTLADPANKNINFKGGAMATKTFNTKKRGGMFHSMYIDSYLDTGNLDSLNYLVSVGYNKQELMALRRHKKNGGKIRVNSGGFIPNFASPLEDAIGRESAAGIPKSMMRVESDPSLRNPENPMGLGVTNRMDEPLGIKQGIRRSKSMGIDPRSHGSSNNSTYAGGMIPNYVNFGPDGQTRNATVLPKTYVPKYSDLGSSVPAKAEATATALANVSDAAGDATKSITDNMGAMFGLTTVTYMLQGMFSETEGTVGEVARGLTGLAMAATQGQTAFLALDPIGKGLAAKGAKKGGIGGAAMGLGRFLGPVGAGLAILGPMVNSVAAEMDFFKSNSEKATETLEKTTKSLESMQKAVSASEAVEKSRKAFQDAQKAADASTTQGRLKTLGAQEKVLITQDKLSKALSSLSENAHLSGADLAKVMAGTSEGMEILRKATVQAAQAQTAQRLATGYLKTKDDGGYKFMDFLGDIGDGLLGGAETLFTGSTDIDVRGRAPAATQRHELQKQQQRLISAQTANTNFLSSGGDAKAALPVLQGLLKDTFNQTQSGGGNSLFEDTQGLGKMKGGGNITQLLKLLGNKDANLFLQEIVKNLSENAKAQKQAKREADHAAHIQKLITRHLTELDGHIQRISLQEDEQSKLNKQITQNNKGLLDASLARKSRFMLLTKEEENQQRNAAEISKIEMDHKNNVADIEKNSRKSARDSISKFNLESVFNAPTAPSSNKLSPAQPYLTQMRGVRGDDFNPSFTDSSTGKKVEAFSGINAEEVEANLKAYIVSLNDLTEQRNFINDMIKAGVIQETAATLRLSAGLDNIVADRDTQLTFLEAQTSIAKTQAGQLYELSEAYEETLVGARDLAKSYFEQDDRAGKVAEIMTRALKANMITLSTTYDRNEHEKSFLKSTEGAALTAHNEMLTKTVALQEQEKRNLTLKALYDNELYLKELSEEEIRIKEEDVALAHKKAMTDRETGRDQNIPFKNQTRSLETNRQNLLDRGQAIASKRAFYSGNSLKTAEVNVEAAQHRKDLNEELGQGSMFADQMAVRIAEANLEMEKFGETLANTAFDSTKEAFKGLLDNMRDGTKSLTDVASEFFGTIVSSIHDKLIERAASQITSGIFESLGLGEMNKGGIVSRYSAGGTTRQVPAMLTSGEYVVRKKLVDKLGTNEFNKFNQSGDLEDLYNQPNQESFELNEGGQISAPSIMRLKEGGVANNYLSSLTSVISRFLGGVVKMKEGGILSSNASDSAGMKIAKGAGYLGGASLAAYHNRKKDEDTGPEAPILQALNTSSKLNISQNDARMSARFRKNSQYHKDQGQYLLDKYDYEIGKKNKKVKERAGLVSGIVNSIGMMGITAGAKAIGNYAEHKYKNSERGMISQLDHDMKAYQENPTPSRTEGRKDYYTGLKMGSVPAASSTSINNSITSNAVAGGSSSSVTNMGMSSSRSSVSTTNNSSYRAGDAARNFLRTNDYSDRSSYKQGDAASYYLSRLKSESSNQNYYGGGIVNNTSNSIHGGARHMSSGGMVHGPGGIDKVGPVLLDRGEFVVKANTVNKVEKQYPGFFDRLNSMKMNEGGIVDPGASSNSSSSEVTNNENSSSNVTVNINVSSGGETTVSGGEEGQQQFASKIKEAVVGVIAQEKRVGGMLS